MSVRSRIPSLSTFAPTTRRLAATRVPIAWTGLAAFTIVIVAWLSIKPVSHTLTLWGDAILCVAGHLAAVLFALPLSRRSFSDPQRLPARCRIAFALGLLCFATGQAAYYYQLLVAHDVPFPSVADIFFVAVYPCWIAAVLMLPGGRANRGRVLADSLMIIAALAAFSWYFVVGPMIAQGSATLLTRILGPAYPVLDLVVLFCLMLVTGTGRGAFPRRGIAPVVVGLTVAVGIDTIYAYLTSSGNWTDGTLLDPVWPVAYLMIGLGVARLRRRHAAVAAPSDALPSAWWSALPYLLIPLVGALACYVEWLGNEGPVGRGVYVCAAVLVTSVVIRQLLSIRENAHLNHHLSRSEARFRAIFENAGVGISLVDARGRQQAVNPEFARFVGYSPEQLAVISFREFTHPDDLTASVGLHSELVAGRLDRYQVEKRYVRSDGDVRWGRLTVSAVQDGAAGSGLAVAMIEDITARKLAEDRMTFQATHDTLTGLPNRSTFHEHVDRALQRARTDPSFRFAVFFLDLDRFKNVNDSLGHAAGDQLLRNVAARLSDSLRRLAFPHAVARLGGDEFTVLVESLPSPDAALDVARALLDDLTASHDLAGQDVTTTCSIGIVTPTPDYPSPHDVLRDADVAMYSAKAAGKNCVAPFDPAMHESAIHRLRLETGLRRALNRDELRLHFQPIISLDTHEIDGFEALVRWDRNGSLVSPADFIPIAEDTGLIVPIGAWVFRQACLQLAAWTVSHPARRLSMSINLSRRQLADPGLLPLLRSVLSETAVDPSLIRLEITESVVIDDAKSARHVLNQIKACGIKLSMDDFGTGYSSLSLLHELPIDILKVDRSFMADLSDRRHAAAVIHAVISLAHNLKMKVVAEGLEHPEQVAFLQALECDFGQGYLFAKPLPAPAATQFLSTPSVIPLTKVA